MINADQIPLGTISEKRIKDIVATFKKNVKLPNTASWHGLILSEKNFGKSLLPTGSFLKLTQEEQAWLQQHQVIRVMNEPDYAPYDFVINGKPVGYSIDYVKLIEGRLGVRFEFVQDNFSELMEKAKKKEVDLLHSLFKYPVEREEFLNFTRPYKSSVNSIVTRKGEEVKNGLLDLKGLRVAAVPGDAASGLLTTNHPEIKLVNVNDYEEALIAVALGRADATILELPTANYLIKKHLINNLSVSSELKEKSVDYRYRLAVRKDWQEFIPILEKAMDSLSLEELDALDEKWMRSADESESSDLPEGFLGLNYIATLIGILVFIVIILLVLYRILDSSKQDPIKFQFSSSSGNKVAITFNSLLISIAFVLGVWALDNIKTKVKQNMQQSLQTVMQTTMEALQIWMEDQFKTLNYIAQDPELLSLTLPQLTKSQRGELLLGTKELEELRNYFQQMRDRGGQHGFFIIDKEGVSIASQRDANVGTVNLIKRYQPDLFQKALNGSNVFVPPMPSDVEIDGIENIKGMQVPPTMFFLVPLKDQDGTVIALLSKRYNPYEQYTRINQLGRLGESGETYMFGKNGELFTESRFQKQLVDTGLVESSGQSILSLSIKDPGEDLTTQKKAIIDQSNLPLTFMAASATRGESNVNVEGYRDYRGVSVIGAWSWDHEHEVGIATEVDLDESLSAYYSARNVVITTLGITVFVSTALTLLAMILSRRANRALLAAHNTLEDRVEQRTNELRKSEERFELAMRGANDGLWDWNFKTGEVFYSKRWMAMLGYKPGELPSTLETWTNLCHPEDANITLLQVEECEKGKKDSFNVEFRMAHKEGRWVSILSRAYACRDPETHEVTRFVGTHIDLSERKEMEAELRSAKEIAESANKAKSEFLASMSHEIRTPMNGVIGMLGLMLNNELSQAQIQRAKVAQSSAQSLLSLINDILDFSKVEAGKIELEFLDFNLRDTLNEIAKSMMFKASENDVEILLDVNEVTHSLVNGDPGRIRQIIVNLIGNAIKFSAHGEVLLKASLTEIEKGKVNFVCKVIDSGIGIPEHKIDDLFSSFTQADSSTTRKYGGTGLGLAICKKLVELMQGKISVSSKEGEGSCFEFNLILNTSEKSIPVLPRVDVSQLNVLIIDDSETNREIFKSQLNQWGARVTLAQDSLTALSICTRSEVRPFDIILLDMNMPDTSGINLAKKLKALPNLESMRIILMTSTPDLVSMQELRRVGISACFVKPVSDGELFEALRVVGASSAAELESSPMVTKSYLSTLPAEPLVKEEKVAEVKWPVNSRVLLVEDNHVNQLVAEGILEEVGLKCDVACNGIEAIDKLNRLAPAENYSLILMDCEMPELDGYETTIRIRNGTVGEKFTAIPIIAMTAHAMQGAREKCLSCGMNDYIAKPIEAEELYTLCKKWLLAGAETNLTTTDEKSTNTRTPQKLNGLIFPDETQLFDFKDKKPSILAYPEIYLKAIQAFAKQYRNFNSQLNAALKSENKQVVKQLVHAVKGSAGNLGIRKLFSLCTSIEQDIVDNQDVGRNQLKELQGVMELAIDEIESIRQLNQQEIQASDPSEPSESFESLRSKIYQLLEHSQYIPQDLLSDFIESTKNTNRLDLGHKIVEALDSFEYEKAIEILDQYR
ncbi:MAG: response regulator [Kangiellaceae bacterium]|nr:response regulator [Kangiellaceae bacterium]